MSWARWIPVFSPHCAGALVEPAALVRLQALARRLPEDCLGAVEIRLAPSATADRAPVDLSIRIVRPDQALALSAQMASPALRLFLLSWADGSIPHRTVPAIWLEYDLDRQPVPRTPIVCARLAPDLDAGWLTGRLLHALRGAPLPSPQRRLVRKCLDAVPDGVQPLYLFDLRARGGAEVRLELYAEELSALLRYLRRVAPEAAARRVARLVPLVERCDRFHLSIDLGIDVSPRIGLEAAFRRLPKNEPRWGELRDALVAESLCSRSRGEAVMRWPGYDSIWTAPRRWPGGETDGAGRPRGYAVRCLSHFKLVSSNRGTWVKAYLLFQHLPSPAPGTVVFKPHSKRR